VTAETLGGPETSEIPVSLTSATNRARAARTEFARRVRRGDQLIVPGVTNGLTARVVERADFGACYATGAGIANVEFGLPDIGLIGLSEVADQVRRICGAVTLPVVVDADTGHGGPLSVMRTVSMLEAAGAAAIQIEDQTMPKSCGHFDGHEIVESWEMQAKVEAAVNARGSDDLLIIARTDAIGVLGPEEAIRRGHAFLEAGADMLFIEAPTDVEQLRRIGDEFAGVPLVANVVEGGRTPQLSAAELFDLGFTFVLFANFLMRIMTQAGIDGLASLRTLGDSRLLSDSMLSWHERQNLVGLNQFRALDNRYASWEFRPPAATGTKLNGQP
jgi:2-methylisocitrate lyase-like PEP mutase family enzyme